MGLLVIVVCSPEWSKGWMEYLLFPSSHSTQQGRKLGWLHYTRGLFMHGLTSGDPMDSRFL